MESLYNKRKHFPKKFGNIDTIYCLCLMCKCVLVSLPCCALQWTLIRNKPGTVRLETNYFPNPTSALETIMANCPDHRSQSGSNKAALLCYQKSRDSNEKEVHKTASPYTNVVVVKRTDISFCLKVFPPLFFSFCDCSYWQLTVSIVHLVQFHKCPRGKLWGKISQNIQDRFFCFFTVVKKTTREQARL